MNSECSKLSQDEMIIKILEFVYKNKQIHYISPTVIKAKLFPELELNEIEDLFGGIKNRKVPVISHVFQGSKHHITYRMGLEDYTKEYKQMRKREKLHRIVEFLSTESERLNKHSFDSGEIVKAFIPELSIYAVNTFCKTIINNGDLIDCTTKDESARKMIAVMVINATHDAYHTKKYLEEDEPIILPINQNIVTGDNISMIGGNNYGEVKQEDHQTIRKPKIKGLPLWAQWIAWIVGILLLIGTILLFFI